MKTIILTIILLTSVLRVELAITPDQQEIGMMDRKSWGSIDAMLFINDAPHRVTFWMKRTFLPMTLVYADSNFSILEIVHPTPLSTELIPSRSSKVMYIFEINPQKTNLIFQNYDLFKKRLIEQMQEAKMLPKKNE